MRKIFSILFGRAPKQQLPQPEGKGKVIPINKPAKKSLMKIEVEVFSNFDFDMTVSDSRITEQASLIVLLGICATQTQKLYPKNKMYKQLLKIYNHVNDKKEYGTT